MPVQRYRGEREQGSSLAPCCEGRLVMEQIESELWEKLKEVIDPGANLNVVDMGLIKELSISDDNTVDVVFRPSSPVCPLAFVLAVNIKEALERVDRVGKVHLKVVDFVRADELNKLMESDSL